MAWNRIGNFAALSLAFIFAACGGDSGSNGKTETDESSQAEIVARTAREKRLLFWMIEKHTFALMVDGNI